MDDGKITVRAKGDMEEKYKAVGYYNHERMYPGDVFEINEKDYSSSWMEKLSASDVKDAQREMAAAAADRKAMKGRVKL
jgi:hypothetical protein